MQSNLPSGLRYKASSYLQIGASTSECVTLGVAPLASCASSRSSPIHGGGGRLKFYAAAVDQTRGASRAIRNADDPEQLPERRVAPRGGARCDGLRSSGTGGGGRTLPWRCSHRLWRSGEAGSGPVSRASPRVAETTCAAGTRVLRRMMTMGCSAERHDQQAYTRWAPRRGWIFRIARGNNHGFEGDISRAGGEVAGAGLLKTG